LRNLGVIILLVTIFAVSYGHSELAFCAALTPQAISPWAHRLFQIVTQVLGALVSPMGLIAAIGFSPSWASQESGGASDKAMHPFSLSCLDRHEITRGVESRICSGEINTNRTIGKRQIWAFLWFT
jgi:hypothetical protein